MKKVTIIGAGLGGLSAGALLSKNGFEVTVLEQHTIVGGCATTFRRKHFICEVGLHEMDGVYTNRQLRELFETLDVYNHVEFVRAPEFFEMTTKNGTFTMPDGIDEARYALIEAFPMEREGIQRYFDLIESIAKQMDLLQAMRWHHYVLFPLYFHTVMRYRNKTVTEVCDTLFRDEALKMALNANIQYYNDTPDTLSFLLHAVAQYSYYKGGGFFIKGGSGRLSDYFADVITQNGGRIITKAMVTQCSANAVTYRYKNENHTLKSDIIVSNLSPQDTYALFNVAYRETREVADSLLTIYIGFSKNLKSVYGKRAYSNFFYEGIGSLGEFNQMLKCDITKRGFVFVDYSQIDSGLSRDEKRSFGVVCLTDYLQEWNTLSQEAYQLKKLKLESALIEKLERHYPGISNLVEYIETGTAKTVERYIKTPNGTAYGFKPTPAQFFKMPKTRSRELKNLYFTGQWVISGGFSAAMMSGQYCAHTVMKDNPL